MTASQLSSPQASAYRVPPLESGDALSEPPRERLTRPEFERRYAAQPDIVLVVDEAAGGQARLSEDGYLEGSPELVIEIAASSAVFDLGDKKQAYRRNGVAEYLVWQVFENKIDWYALTDGDYQLLPVRSD